MLGVLGGRVSTGGKGSKIGNGSKTGPNTPEGIERCRRSHWRHGYYGREAKAVRREVRTRLKALRGLIAIAAQTTER